MHSLHMTIGIVAFSLEQLGRILYQLDAISSRVAAVASRKLDSAVDTNACRRRFRFTRHTHPSSR
jgi:hypothetical protein